MGSSALSRGVTNVDEQPSGPHILTGGVFLPQEAPLHFSEQSFLLQSLLASSSTGRHVHWSPTQRFGAFLHRCFNFLRNVLRFLRGLRGLTCALYCFDEGMMSAGIPNLFF